MSKLRRWSSKYVTYADGDTMWVRADYVDRMRERLIAGGMVETGQVTVTGGKTYFEFLMDGPQEAAS